jgi:hypothetical protein
MPAAAIMQRGECLLLNKNKMHPPGKMHPIMQRSHSLHTWLAAAARLASYHGM